MLFRMELWRQWQPLMFPSIPAYDAALRSIKRERRKVDLRVRSCKITKIQD